MDIVYGAVNYSQHHNKLQLALGNFDGLHLAHRCIINRACTLARQKGHKSAVFIFDPHPVTRLYTRKNFLLLTSVKRRAEILEEMGVDYLIVEKFNEIIASMPPYRFVLDYLVNILNVGGVVVGFDYTFGSRGRGTPGHLLKWSEKFGFNVEIVPPVIVGDEVVSSSLIRDLLSKGKVRQAAQYLGSNYKISGQVVHGEGRGRTLGFPTANLEVDENLLLPANGVYLCSTQLNGQKHFALTNIGKKPTFHLDKNIIVEVYLIDFTGDLYGKELTVEFLHRIRKETAFSGADSLKEQICADLQQSRVLIKQEYSSFVDNTCS